MRGCHLWTKTENCSRMWLVSVKDRYHFFFDIVSVVEARKMREREYKICSFAYIVLSSSHRFRSSSDYILRVMPAKKSKQIMINESTISRTTTESTTSKSDVFVLLRDERNSRHVIFPRDKLIFAKKDNLKIGTYACFKGNGDRSSRCRGIVVLTGNSKDIGRSLNVFFF